MTKHIYLFLALLIATLATGCAATPKREPRFVAWGEEVKLNDGRVVVVSQIRPCDPSATWLCDSRETFLTINLPEFSPAPIVWHEHLDARVMNIHDGFLYVVGYPFTKGEWAKYGNPEPPWIGYRYQHGQWRRIPFNEIPREIYETNLVISLHDVGVKHVTLELKNSYAMNQSHIAYQRRIIPTHRFVP